MRRAAIAVVMMGFLAGCADDPETGRLSPGSDAMTYRKPPDATAKDADSSRVANLVTIELGRPGSLPGMTIEILDVGTKVRVVSDPGPGSDARREVQVRVVEGRHDGIVGTIGRDELRPIPERK